MTDLSKKMLNAAAIDNLSLDHPLVQRAKEFDIAAEGFYAEPQTVSVKQFMGAWARARKAWCLYSSEPLI